MWNSCSTSFSKSCFFIGIIAGFFFCLLSLSVNPIPSPPHTHTPSSVVKERDTTMKNVLMMSLSVKIRRCNNDNALIGTQQFPRGTQSWGILFELTASSIRALNS